MDQCFFIYTKPYTPIRRGEWADLLVSTSLCPPNLMTVVPAKKREREEKSIATEAPFAQPLCAYSINFFSRSWLNFPRYLAHFLPPYESRLQKPFDRPRHNSTKCWISFFVRLLFRACVPVSLLHKMWPQKPFLWLLHKSINVAVEWADMIIIVTARETLLHKCTAGSGT